MLHFHSVDKWIKDLSGQFCSFLSRNSQTFKMSYCFYTLKCLKDLPRERMRIIYDFPIYLDFKYLSLLITGRKRQL